MIRPLFSISQTNEHLILSMTIKYVKISTADFFVADNTFRFHLSPYFLSLTFKQNLKNQEVSSVTYNHNNYQLTVKLEKKNKGEHFEDLELTNLLVTNSKVVPKKGPTIELLSESPSINLTEENSPGSLEKEMEALSIDKRIGFSRRFTNFFEHLREELADIAEFDPEQLTFEQRKMFQLDQEDYKFDPNSETDFEEVKDLIIQPLLLPDAKGKMVDFSFLADPSKVKMEKILTADQHTALLNIKKREFLMSKTELNSAFLSVLDVLLAFLFDYRSNGFSQNCESSWAINKLSATLCCFVEYDSIKDLLKSFVRRAVTYPFYRSYELAIRTIDDLKRVLELGKVFMVKILMIVREIFNKTNPKYLLNTLFIEDMIVFSQILDSQMLTEAVEFLTNFEIDFEELEFPEKEEEEEKEDNVKNDEKREEAEDLKEDDQKELETLD